MASEHPSRSSVRVWECPECGQRISTKRGRPECLGHAEWRYPLGKQPVMREIVGQEARARATS